MKSDATDFNAKAATWDADDARLRLASDVAGAIIRETAPSKEMDVLDFGCGSGLLTLKLQPLVGSIVGVDSSRGMLEVLRSKVESQRLKNVRIRLADLEHEGTVKGRYHLIVSSMALHHVTDAAALVRKLAGMLHPGGRLAIADLDAEDGTFHEDNTGVRHFGFERPEITRLFEEAGLREVRVSTAGARDKERASTGRREYTLFLATGTR
jgi:2-polyprenyl-3-methyl-5-hydroxy-6-metoxy-1,4-benzoquinol methylase